MKDVQVECVSDEKAKFKSYKVTVPKTQFENLFNEELWPEGVRVQSWRERRILQNDSSSDDVKDDHRTTVLESHGDHLPDIERKSQIPKKKHAKPESPR